MAKKAKRMGMRLMEELSFSQITRAQSPASQIRTAVSWFIWLAKAGWTFWYSFLTKDAAAAAQSASTKAIQQPLNPAPLNLAPNTPGALRRIS